MYTAAQHNVTVKITGISIKSTCSHIEPLETHMTYPTTDDIISVSVTFTFDWPTATWQMYKRTRATQEEKNIAFDEREDKKKG